MSPPCAYCLWLLFWWLLSRHLLLGISFRDYRILMNDNHARICWWQEWIHSSSNSTTIYSSKYSLHRLHLNWIFSERMSSLHTSRRIRRCLNVRGNKQSLPWVATFAKTSCSSRGTLGRGKSRANLKASSAENKRFLCLLISLRGFSGYGSKLNLKYLKETKSHFVRQI